jgi:hypothetical protein
MTNFSPLTDADARQIGETTFDRNVVVLAGAGTGAPSPAPLFPILL